VLSHCALAACTLDRLTEFAAPRAMPLPSHRVKAPGTDGRDAVARSCYCFLYHAALVKGRPVEETERRTERASRRTRWSKENGAAAAVVVAPAMAVQQRSAWVCESGSALRSVSPPRCLHGFVPSVWPLGLSMQEEKQKPQQRNLLACVVGSGGSDSGTSGTQTNCQRVCAARGSWSATAAGVRRGRRTPCSPPLQVGDFAVPAPTLRAGWD
jgi:hypothetical protein